MAKRNGKPEPRSAQEKVLIHRKLKVCETHYPNPDPSKGCIHIPWIQMRGYWLEQLGFRIGTPLEVYATDGWLLLKVVASPGQ